jgi:hypothetical protein
MTPRADVTSDIEAMSLWAGQGVGLVRRARPAADIVAEIVTKTHAAKAAGARPRRAQPSGADRPRTLIAILSGKRINHSALLIIGISRNPGSAPPVAPYLC